MKMWFHPNLIKHVRNCFLLLSYFHPHTHAHPNTGMSLHAHTPDLPVFFCINHILELLVINYDILIVITAHTF